MSVVKSGRRYDVAISFAGEDRRFAETLAHALSSRGVSVFYDSYEKADLWGKNLYTHLSDIYRNQARYCILLLSRHYASKVWTRHELEAAQARAFVEHHEYILPVRFDKTEITGVLPTIGYLGWPPENQETIADAVVAKLAGQPREQLTPPGPFAAAAASATPVRRTLIRRYCKDCGAVPGAPSKCTVGISHSFVEGSGSMYCRDCGAVPGAPSKCSVGISHSFVSA